MRYFFCLLNIILPFCLFAKGSDTIKVFFDLNVSEISPAYKKKIDSLIYNDIFPPGKKIGLLGYADYLGDDTSNITLSNNRVNNVKQYLISMGIYAKEIQMAEGLGEIKRDSIQNPKGFAADRRVDVILGGFKTIQTKVKGQAKAKLDITKVKKNEAIRLNNIFFYPGRHKVREESLSELQSLYNIMIENPTLKIRIEGHICCLTQGATDGYDYDTEDFNLSVNRAKEIYNYLRIRKIDVTRLEYSGFGKTRPLIDPEKNEADENMNRRVEIRILDK